MEQAEEAFAQETRDITSAILPQLAPLQLPDEPSRPFGQGAHSFGDLDLTAVVKQRYDHQTLHAANSVRTRGISASEEAQKEISVRRRLIQELQAIISSTNEAKAGGLDRQSRWGSLTSTGNAANAAKVAKANHEKVRKSLK